MNINSGFGSEGAVNLRFLADDCRIVVYEEFLECTVWWKRERRVQKFLNNQFSGNTDEFVKNHI